MVLLVCCTVIIINAGIRLSFGVFFNPLEKTFNIGRSSLSLIQSFFELGFGLFQLTMGRIVDVRGPKKVIWVGLVIMALSFLLLIRAKAVWTFYLVYGVFLAFGAGSTSLVTNIVVIKNWFKGKSSLAVSSATASVSAGQLVLIPVISYFVVTVSWRAGYLYLALLTIIAALMVIIGLPNSKRPISGVGSPQKIISTKKFFIIAGSRSFLVLGCVFAICGFGFSFIATHLVPFVIDLHWKPGDASNTLAIIGGISIIGTLGVGYLSGKFSKRIITFILFIIRAVAMNLLLIFSSDIGVYVFTVIMGLTWTATVPLITDLSSDTFGSENTGTVLGALFLLHQLGAAAGSFAGGLVSDYTHGYHIMFFISAVLDLGAALLILSHRNNNPASGIPVNSQ